MLSALFGNRNIERILLFIFVNGKSYGTQLSRQLKTPLTPVQQALSRLERGGVLTSRYEGKTRVYTFHPSYPLLAELEGLLRSAYAFLPAEEKRTYYLPLLTLGRKKGMEGALFAFWERLRTVKELSFTGKTDSREERGWNGHGKGSVFVVAKGHNVLLFEEKGQWHGRQGPSMAFSNVFRWTLDPMAGRIALEHLRRGPDQPVFLFHLAPSGKQTLASVDSHLCGEDAYYGRVHFDNKGFRLHWRILGPHKNENIDYFYA